MLPFGLKIAWFVLSFMGMISCWAVFAAFASLLQTYWWGLIYCVGVTCLEGMFWLGIVWKMDPMRMPRSFCLAQTFISGFASFILASVVATFTMATFGFVTHPKRWPEGELYVLRWRTAYIIPLLLFPLLALTAQVSVTLTLDAVQPSNSLNCDAINPIWTRFLSYAGSPLLLCIPSFFVTAYCMTRVYKTHQHIKRSRTRYPRGIQDNFTAPPNRRPHTPRATVTSSPSVHPLPVGREQLSSSTVISTPRRFHFPFSSSSRSDIKDSSRNSSHLSMPREIMSSDSAESDAFPTFAPPSNEPSIRETGSDDVKEGQDKNLDGIEVTLISDVEKDVWQLKETDTSNTEIVEMVQWKKGSIEPVLGKLGHDNVNDEVNDEDDDAASWRKPAMRHSTAFSHRSRRPLLCNLPPSICRILRFQMTFNLIQFVSSISTLIYAIRGHSPPFHAHHVSLLLFAWAPVLFFGSLPEVQHQLRFWAGRPERRADCIDQPSSDHT